MREGLLLHLLQAAGGKPTFPMVKEVMDYKLLKNECDSTRNGQDADLKWRKYGKETKNS
jgi:hypothetical protein